MNTKEETSPKRRTTRQRRAIMEYLRGATSHPSASTVYEEMRKRIPDISLGTVYRTLGVLREDGAIQELPYGDHSRFDARTDNHYHIVCLSCGRVADADLDQTAVDLASRLQVPGFQVVSHRLEFLGYCADCLAALSAGASPTRDEPS